MISEFKNPWRIFLSFQNRVYSFISLFYYFIIIQILGLTGMQVV
jgi:hypothetical protein